MLLPEILPGILLFVRFVHQCGQFLIGNRTLTALLPPGFEGHKWIGCFQNLPTDFETNVPLQCNDNASIDLCNFYVKAHR